MRRGSGPAPRDGLLARHVVAAGETLPQRDSRHPNDQLAKFPQFAGGLLLDGLECRRPCPARWETGRVKVPVLDERVALELGERPWRIPGIARFFDVGTRESPSRPVK